MKILSSIERFFMILTTREYVFLGLIVLAIILLFTGIPGCQHKNDNVITVYPRMVPTEQKKDANGNSYTEIKGTLYTQAQMKVITDSIQRVLGKGKVVQVTRTITKIDTHYVTKNVYVDTVAGTISASDSNKDVQQTFTGNYRTHIGKFTLRLTPDTATRIGTIKKHLLKSDEYTQSEYHTNSLFRPSEGYTYTYKEQKVLGSIGPSIGVGYCSDGKLHGMAGISIVFNLIGIKSR